MLAALQHTLALASVSVLVLDDAEVLMEPIIGINMMGVHVKTSNLLSYDV